MRIGLQPTAPDVRQRSDEWLWAAQRRFGLYVSQPRAVFLGLAADAGDHYDPFGDRLSYESLTDASAPHVAVLRVLHDATQATAAHQVVLGDKSDEDAYAAYNATPSEGGTVVDLAEPRMGKSGADLCFTDLVEESASPSPGTVFCGDTHAFGNTEERAIAEVLGVPARADSHGRAWDHGTGEGAVKWRKGTYHDAIHVKLNTVVLFLVNLFGGLAPGAVKHLRDLSRRPVDRTEYELELYDKYVPDGTARHRSNDKYVQYWARRLSSAAVMAQSAGGQGGCTDADAARPATAHHSTSYQEGEESREEQGDERRGEERRGKRHETRHRDQTPVLSFILGSGARI